MCSTREFAILYVNSAHVNISWKYWINWIRLAKIRKENKKNKLILIQERRNYDVTG